MMMNDEMVTVATKVTAKKRKEFYKRCKKNGDLPAEVIRRGIEFYIHTGRTCE